MFEIGRKSLWWLGVFGLAGVVGAIPALANDPGGLSDAEIQEILADHNRERAAVGTPPLTWSPEISAHAGEWARTLQSQGCVLQHRGVDSRIYGENIQDLVPGFGPGAAPENWASEKELYHGETIGDPDFVALHYSAMVWRTTTQMGCGVAWCGERGILVCNYHPQGNVSGQRPY